MATTTVLALFTDRRDAEAAVRALQSAEFGTARLGVVPPGQAHVPPFGQIAAAGIAAGTIGCGLVGVLAGIALAGLFPGTHAVLPGGWFVVMMGALTGAATGAVAGLLVSQSVARQHTLYYEEEMEAGRTLVTVEAEPDRADHARRLLLQEGAFEAAPIDTPHPKAS
jgi:hypothetical protein